MGKKCVSDYRSNAILKEMIQISHCRCDQGSGWCRDIANRKETICQSIAIPSGFSQVAGYGRSGDHRFQKKLNHKIQHSKSNLIILHVLGIVWDLISYLGHLKFKQIG